MKNVGVWQLLDEVVSRELFQVIIWCTGYFRWLGLILTLDILARDILARTFHHGDFLCTRTFRHHGRYGTGTFWHKDILALEYFGIRIFWPMDVLVDVHFGTLQSNIDRVPKYLGLKCSNTVTSPCRNIQSAKNIPMPKSS